MRTGSKAGRRMAWAGRWSLTVSAMCWWLGASAPGQQILSLENGYLTFTNENPSLYYRIEFKPNLTGAEPWDGTYRGLKNIQSDESTITVPVGVFYRVAGSAEPIGGGTAAAADLLAGKTAFVNDVEVTGTMPKIGTQKIVPGTTAQTISLGWHDGKGSVAGDANLISANIRAGVKIFNVVGTAQSATGNAETHHVLSGKTFSREGALGLIGIMPNHGARVFYPGPASQSIDEGYYAGARIEGDANLISANIRSGVSVFGVAGSPTVVDTASGNAEAGDLRQGKRAWAAGHERVGTMPDRSVQPDSGILQAGFYEETVLSDVNPNLAPENIRSGVSLFGTTGSLRITQLPRTGQTTEYRTGDDGAVKAGVAWPNPRFTDHGDGTVTDHLTGLMWTKNANWFGQRNWNAAIDDCNGMNASGGTFGYTDWRLPNWRELHSLIDATRYNPALPAGHPFEGSFTTGSWYWSSTTASENTSSAVYINVGTGSLSRTGKENTHFVWPVRGGLPQME